MFYYHYGMAAIDEFPKREEQFFDVGEMQSRRGLIEDEERAPLISFPCLRQMTRQLESLSLPTRECGNGLSQSQIVESHGMEWSKSSDDGGILREVVHSLCHGHLQHVSDGL